MTDLQRFSNGDEQTKATQDQNCRCVVVIVITEPENQRRDLEDVEGMDALSHDQLERRLERNVDETLAKQSATGLPRKTGKIKMNLVDTEQQYRDTSLLVDGIPE